MEGDTYDEEKGVRIAYAKALIKQYQSRIKKLQQEIKDLSK
jgi:ABC-type Fe3+-hydroxamate transport system substrate-binding protein